MAVFMHAGHGGPCTGSHRLLVMPEGINNIPGVLFIPSGDALETRCSRDTIGIRMRL